MTEDSLVSKWNVAAGVLWASVVGLMVAAWAVMFAAGDWKMAGMLAATACATGGAAAVLHVRGYFVRLCRVIRVSQGLPGPVEDRSNGPRPLR